MRRPSQASQGEPGDSSEPQPSPAARLWRAGSIEGAAACGFAGDGGQVVIRADHPSLELVAPDLLLDAIVFGAGCSIVDRVEAA